MRRKRLRWIVILLILIFIAIAADVAVRVLALRMSQPPSECLAIPTEFLLGHPDCAEKLIRAANITNVHIVSMETLEAQSDILKPVQPKS